MKFNKRLDYVILIDELFQSVFHKLKMSWNFNSWPIIKNQVGYFLHLIYIGKIDASQIKRSPSTQIALTFSFGDFFRLIKFGFIAHKLKRKWKNALNDKTLLVSWKIHTNSKNENIYISPFEKILEENDEAYILLETDGDTTQAIFQLYSILTNYHSLRFRFSAQFSKHLKITKDNSKTVTSFFEKDEISPHKDIGYAEEIGTIIYNNIIENQIYYKTYSDFIKTISPKLIWTYNYYETNHLALSRAANTLNIPLVEYQHSVISDSHFAYSKWEQIDLYAEHFPGFFWAWDTASSNIYTKNFKNGHRTIIGGNLEVMIQKRSVILESIEKRKNKILVSLQGNWIPQFIENFIAKNNTYIWYFRLHPRYPGYEDKLATLKEAFPEKIEISLANSLSLHDLFSIVGYNLTSFSGTAMEAHSFDIKNIIFGEDGYDTYQSQIDDKSFAYIQNEEELEKLLNNDRFLLQKKELSSIDMKAALYRLYK